VAHKISCLKTLFNRINTHCSTPDAKKNEERQLYNIFRANGYPNNFVRRYIKQTNPRQQPRSLQNDDKSKWRSIPYINTVSEATARILAPYGIKVAHKPTSTLRGQLMKPKTPLEASEKSAVVYRINCKKCVTNYVGETGKRLGTRLHEHECAIRRQEGSSQLWMHMVEADHQFNFPEANVIAQGGHKGIRLMNEAWFSESASINRRIDLHLA